MTNVLRAFANAAPQAQETRKRSHLFIACCALLTLLFIASTLNAQSGRLKPEPTPTPKIPATQRPRRSTPSASDNLPGQPATPNVPSSTSTPGQNKAHAIGETDSDEVIQVNANLVPVAATVLDEQGRAVTDLELKDFELRVDGQPKPIGEVTRAETPVRLALLFDNSGSLKNAHELEKQAAIRFFRTVLRPVDQAAIFSIWTVPMLEQPLTSDVNVLVRTIERYGEPEGATALFDTVAQAADYLRKQPGRRVIIIVSDGADTVSNLDFNESLRRVQAADCQIYAVQYGISDNVNLHDLAAERRLQEFTSQTGGTVYTPKVASDLNEAFAQISADLAQQYILSYYPTDERRDNQFRIISVRITTRPHMRVRARRGYYPRTIITPTHAD